MTVELQRPIFSVAVEDSDPVVHFRTKYRTMTDWPSLIWER